MSFCFPDDACFASYERLAAGRGRGPGSVLSSEAVLCSVLCFVLCTVQSLILQRVPGLNVTPRRQPIRSVCVVSWPIRGQNAWTHLTIQKYLGLQGWVLTSMAVGLGHINFTDGEITYYETGGYSIHNTNLIESLNSVSNSIKHLHPL